MAELLDTRRYLETPEGVEVAVDVAGPLARGWAWLIDSAIRSFLHMWVGLCLVFLGDAGIGLFLVWLFLLEWFYPVVFEARLGGATPGKMAMRLVVLHDDGTPVGWRAAIVRNLLRFVDHLPMLPIFGLVSMGVSSDFKRLGDHAAGTVVAYRHKAVARQALPDVPAVPPPVALAVHEQRAIVDYAQRSTGWSEARQAEMAAHLAPIVGGPGPVAAKRLQGVARWLLGGR